MEPSKHTYARLDEDRFVLIVAAAFASHLFFFRLVELWPIQLAKLYSTLFLLDFLLRHLYSAAGILPSLAIGIYRLFFHRISHIPGPRAWALSKWSTFRADLEGLRPRVVHQAHIAYSDVVRTGPREISINSPHAVSAITSAKSDCCKGPWYESAAGGREPRFVRSLLTLLDRSEHQRRRKAWDSAFSAKALKGYEEALVNNIDVMLRQLEKRAEAGQEVAIDDWGMLFAFDLISEVGFGKNLGLLEQGKLSPMLEDLEHALKFQQVINNRPYMVEITRQFPNPVMAFGKMVFDLLVDRQKDDGDRKDDIMTFLYEAGGQATSPDEAHKYRNHKAGKKDKDEILAASSEARLIIIAGSDTSSTVMAMSLFLLLQHPKVLQSMRDELDAVFGIDTSHAITDFAQLDKACPLLNAVINESMRLYPPVAGGLQKVNSISPTPVQLHSGERIIVPKDTAMTIPTMAMHRDPRNFSPAPDAFRPERWLAPEKEERFERKAFIPFSAGATVCPGKLLAYTELRLVIANLVRRFEMEPVDGFDAKEFEDGVRDCFASMRRVKLAVRLRVRADGAQASSHGATV
ncbi:hypothetical protein NDA16_003423 [Ustilago loliicola]|nr:hypothetical protein NDA16_003423 [Ustilago loliicola]